MKEHRGDEIRQIMHAMPSDLVAALQRAYAEHEITEREARWWGYLQFARSGAYDGVEFTTKVGNTGDVHTERFLPYVLSARARDERFGSRPRAWPDTDVDNRPAG